MAIFKSVTDTNGKIIRIPYIYYQILVYLNKIQVLFNSRSKNNIINLNYI